jgi:site-specific recombinase XerD
VTSSTHSASPHDSILQIFDARIQTLTTPHRCYRVAARRFLSYLQTDFPQLCLLSEFRRDPHLLGWLRSLCRQDPPLSSSTRRIYLIALRRLLHDMAAAGHPLQPDLILPEDFPPHPRRHPDPPSPAPHPCQEFFDARIQILATTLRPGTVQSYRLSARHFLAFLQTDFPQLCLLSELLRDPHLLGWLRCLGQQVPPLSPSTQQQHLRHLQRLLRDLAATGHPLQPDLFLPEDFPPHPRRHSDPPPPAPHPCQEFFDAHIQILATTLRPSTVHSYRLSAHRFLAFLQTDFPQVLDLSQLRRNPHLFGWFRYLCQPHPPLSISTRQKYLLNLRRLLHDLAFEGHPLQPDLILPEDVPPRPQYLPRALAPEEDQRLQQELRRLDDLPANALLLTRATGMRIGECINLALDCLRPLGQDQWALHVPLGKLRTERLVPVDNDIRQTVTRILTLRALDPCSSLQPSAGLLLPRWGSSQLLYATLSKTLARAAGRVNCSQRVTCHRLRHTYATEMLRLGVSLPALMQLLGHKDIRMTLRYLQVTQQDLQREFHQARQTAAYPHRVPKLPLPDISSATSDLSGIRRALAATRYLVEMYRRQLGDEKTHRTLRRLDKRLLSVAIEFDQLTTAEK